jgi:hypothetical protein
MKHHQIEFMNIKKKFTEPLEEANFPFTKPFLIAVVGRPLSLTLIR